MLARPGEEHQKFPVGPLVHVNGGDALRDAGVLGRPVAFCLRPQELATISLGQCAVGGCCVPRGVDCAVFFPTERA